MRLAGTVLLALVAVAATARGNIPPPRSFRDVVGDAWSYAGPAREKCEALARDAGSYVELKIVIDHDWRHDMTTAVTVFDGDVRDDVLRCVEALVRDLRRRARRPDHELLPSRASSGALLWTLGVPPRVAASPAEALAAWKTYVTTGKGRQALEAKLGKRVSIGGDRCLVLGFPQSSFLRALDFAGAVGTPLGPEAASVARTLIGAGADRAAIYRIDGGFLHTTVRGADVGLCLKLLDDAPPARDGVTGP